MSAYSAWYSARDWKWQDKKESQGLCPHRVYSLEEKINIKLGNNIGFIRYYGHNRPGWVIEADNRSGKITRK